MKRKIVNYLVILLLVLSFATGCSTFSNTCPKPDIPFKPTLESAQKVHKTITYKFKGKKYELEKGGLYLNQSDTQKLKHYIDSMQNELKDLQ